MQMIRLATPLSVELKQDRVNGKVVGNRGMPYERHVPSSLRDSKRPLRVRIVIAVQIWKDRRRLWRATDSRARHSGWVRVSFLIRVRWVSTVSLLYG